MEYIINSNRNLVSPTILSNLQTRKSSLRLKKPAECRDFHSSAVNVSKIMRHRAYVMVIHKHLF